MENHVVRHKEDLAIILDGYRGHLFRGQTREYHKDHNEIIFKTSFARMQCHPETMIKWTFYAERVFRRFFFKLQDKTSAELPDLIYQAVLQHYGWRSFFVDASSNPAVSAWFAAKRCSQEARLEMTEDCHEVGVALLNTVATYTDHDDIGFLYVISKEMLAECNIPLVCLSGGSDDGYRYRFNAQHAWLLGPVPEGIPTKCVIARIEAPAEALREYAVLAGFESTQSMFPNSMEDPCLKLLLSIPRIVRPQPDKDHIHIFARDLEIPDYHYKPSKIHDDYHAFYAGGRIGEVSRCIDEMLADAFFLTVPDFVMFGCRADEEEITTPIIAALIAKHGRVGIEINGLIRLPDWEIGSIYSKGLFLIREEDGSIIIGDLIIEHPGTLMVSAGTTVGWRYTIDETGRWVRTPHSNDCPCGNDFLHDHHLTILLRVEDLLR